MPLVVDAQGNAVQGRWQINDPSDININLDIASGEQYSQDSDFPVLSAESNNIRNYHY